MALPSHLRVGQSFQDERQIFSFGASTQIKVVTASLRKKSSPRVVMRKSVMHSITKNRIDFIFVFNIIYNTKQKYHKIL